MVTGTVHIDNFGSGVQQVTGSVTVSTFSGSMAVTVTSSLPVTVNNFPVQPTTLQTYTSAPQAVSGTVTITSTGSLGVKVDNFPAQPTNIKTYDTGTQAVSGTVQTYTSGPQGITGSVFVTSTGSLPVVVTSFMGTNILDSATPIPVNFQSIPTVNIGVTGIVGIGSIVKTWDGGTQSVSGTLKTFDTGTQSVSGTVQVFTSGLQGISGTVTTNPTVTGSTGLHVSMPTLVPAAPVSGSCFGIPVTTSNVHTSLGPTSSYWGFNHNIMSGSRIVTLKAWNADIFYRWSLLTSGETVSSADMTGATCPSLLKNGDERSEMLSLATNGIITSGSANGVLFVWAS